MDMRRDTIVWRRNGVSILVLYMIVSSFIGSLGELLQKIDKKEVEGLLLSCGLNKREIREKLYSSNISPKEIYQTLLNCRIDRNNLPIHIPASRNRRYLPTTYLDLVLARSRQLVVDRKNPTSPTTPRLRSGSTPPGNTASTRVTSSSDADADPAPPPRRKTRSPPPAKPARHPPPTVTPLAKKKSPEKNRKSPAKHNDRTTLMIKAVVLSVLGTSSVMLIFFCCYCCKKNRNSRAYNQKDDRPLLRLSLSEFSGSSRTSNCSSPIDVNKLGALKSESGHHQNGFQRNGSQHGHIENGMTTLTSFHGPGTTPLCVLLSAPPPPPLPPFTQKAQAPPGPPPPPPPKGPQPPAGSKPGPPPPPPAKGGTAVPPPPPPGGKKPGGPGPPLPPGPPVLSKARPPPLKPSASKDSNAGGQKPKLKPFFWDKVSANPEQAIVWNEIKSGSFQFSEEMIENLFGVQGADKAKTNGMKGTSQSDLASPCVRLLESKKSQNLAISLKALNVKIEEVLTAVNEGNELPIELVETLLKLWPNEQEETKLLVYSGDLALLSPAEQFLIELIKVNYVYERLDCLRFMASLQEELTTCRKAFATLEVACKELKDSRLFRKILEAVLKIGNFINRDSHRGGAVAIKLDNLLKLRDLKAPKDPKTTLLHVVLQQIIRAEGKRLASQEPNPSGESDEEYYQALGLKVVSGIGDELENVKKSAGLDMDIITSTVEHLGKSLQVIKIVLDTKIKQISGESGFRNVLEYFVNQAEGEVKFLSEEKKRVWELVEETAKSFYPSTKKDENLRLFVVVRDFLWMWDKACKEVKEATQAKPAKPKRIGSKGEGSEVGSASMVRDPRQHLIPAIQNQRMDDSSSDDET